MNACKDAARRIRASGGMAENIYLPDRGIRGNSHMMIMDRNNLEIADLVLSWLAEHRLTQ